jgi:citrate synthase
LKLPWKIVRGIGVLARAIGLVGHILEEMREPLAYEIKRRAEEEATAHLRARRGA